MWPTQALEAQEPEGRRRRHRRLQKRRRRPGAIALGIAPGVALAAATSLVFTWAAGELQRTLLQPWGWSGGVALALLLLGLQLLLLPLRRLRGRAQLHLGDSDQPRRAWAWVSAPWVHGRLREALLTALALLIILGRSPLPFEDVVQRFTLTELTTLALAVGWSRREGLGERSWCGGSGALGALIGLAASLSLLQGQVAQCLHQAQLVHGVEPGDRSAIHWLSRSRAWGRRWRRPREKRRRCGKSSAGTSSSWARGRPL